MRIKFTQRENGPERLVTEAEILFDEPVLSGLKLVGFSLWKSPEGELYVTFPSRAFGSGSERSVEGDAAPGKALKAAIVEAFREQQAAAA